MSQHLSLDELLDKMEREKQPTITFQQLHELSQEEHNRQAAMSQAVSQQNMLANQLGKQNAIGGWPNLNKLSQPKLEMKTFTVRFEQTDEYDEEEIEANRYSIDQTFVTFYNNDNVKVFSIPINNVIFIREEE